MGPIIVFIIRIKFSKYCKIFRVKKQNQKALTSCQITGQLLNIIIMGFCTLHKILYVISYYSNFFTLDYLNILVHLNFIIRKSKPNINLN